MSVTDLVLSVLRLLREDIREVVDSMEPVELHGPLCQLMRTPVPISGAH